MFEKLKYFTTGKMVLWENRAVHAVEWYKRKGALLFPYCSKGRKLQWPECTVPHQTTEHFTGGWCTASWVVLGLARLVSSNGGLVTNFLVFQLNSRLKYVSETSEARNRPHSNRILIHIRSVLPSFSRVCVVNHPSLSLRESGGRLSLTIWLCGQKNVNYNL